MLQQLQPLLELVFVLKLETSLFLQVRHLVAHRAASVSLVRQKAQSASQHSVAQASILSTVESMFLRHIHSLERKAMSASLVLQLVQSVRQHLLVLLLQFRQLQLFLLVQHSVVQKLRSSPAVQLQAASLAASLVQLLQSVQKSLQRHLLDNGRSKCKWLSAA